MSHSFDVIYNLMKAHEKGGDYILPLGEPQEGQELQYNFDYEAFQAKGREDVDFVFPTPYLDAFYIIPYKKLQKSFNNLLEQNAVEIESKKVLHFIIKINGTTTLFLCKGQKIFGTHKKEKDLKSANTYFNYVGGKPLCDWIEENFQLYKQSINIAVIWKNILEVSQECSNKFINSKDKNKEDQNTLGINKRKIQLFNKISIDGKISNEKNFPDALGFIFKTLIEEDREKLLKWSNEFKTSISGFEEIIIRSDNQIHDDDIHSNEKNFYRVFSDGCLYYSNFNFWNLNNILTSVLEYFNMQDKCFVEVYEYTEMGNSKMTDDGKMQKRFKEIDTILDMKGQVILYGPPGTGKTYSAWKYIKNALMKKESDKFHNKKEEDLTEEEKKELMALIGKYVFKCAFHPEYGYGDFISGFRAKAGENSQMAFKIEDGIFKKAADTAREDKGNNYYLLIDEINRGDIPRIFGELITLLEKDKRNEEHAVTLPFAKAGDKPFYVPDNLYIIGTMNTADRSIALLDSALRRRFGFIEMLPEYDLECFKDFPKSLDIKEKPDFKTWFEDLNKTLVNALEEFRPDAKDIQIGHSYFIPLHNDPTPSKRFDQILKYEIIPLIKEYTYEEPAAYKKIDQFFKNTYKSIDDIMKFSPKDETQPTNEKTDQGDPE